jgi:hypothetical protein
MKDKGISPEEYEKNIPKNCCFQTVEEHAKYLLFCWGLLHKLREGKKINKICDGACEHNTLLPKRIINAPLQIMCDYVQYNPKWKRILRSARAKLGKK